MPERFEHGYALLIAVDEHSVPGWALPEVKKDIAALERVLLHPQRCAYPPENLRLVSGKAATRAGIQAGLAWLKERLEQDASANATALIYYSGHGWRDKAVKPEAYYLIPYDTQEDAIRLTAILAGTLAAEIAALQPRRLLVMLDCCHAGGMGIKDVQPGFPSASIPPGVFLDMETGVPQSAGKGLEGLQQGAGRAAFSSSQNDQRSYWLKDESMSIFTYHLIEALTGHTEPKEGAAEVLVTDVMSYVQRKVPASAQAAWNMPQQPDFLVSGGSFPVALLLGGSGLGKGIAPPEPREDLRANPLPEGLRAGAHIQVGEIHAEGEAEVNIAGGNITKTVNTGGAPYVGGNMQGDIVQGNQTVHTENRSVQVNAPVSGSVITTGDHNTVRQGVNPQGDGLAVASLAELVAQLVILQGELAGLAKGASLERARQMTLQNAASLVGEALEAARQPKPSADRAAQALQEAGKLVEMAGAGSPMGGRLEALALAVRRVVII